VFLPLKMVVLVLMEIGLEEKDWSNWMNWEVKCDAGWDRCGTTLGKIEGLQSAANAY
jgi:hypothetical protein